ncbi:MAG: 30S ribosomal protein S8 [Candidatus Moraniibacteriota bacterium]|nr:MAG: 30S ribosomal protein S8 [Candidatus Moranbacteria bacterium]
MLDPISDMLTRIRNAQLAQKAGIVLPSSKLKKAVAEVLKKRGFIEDVRATTVEERSLLEIDLKYKSLGFSLKEPVIHEIHRVSKEGQRVYVRSTDIRKVKNGLGVAVISTSEGVLSGEEARKRGVGGEYVCYIW